MGKPSGRRSQIVSTGAAKPEQEHKRPEQAQAGHKQNAKRIGVSRLRGEPFDAEQKECRRHAGSGYRIGQSEQERAFSNRKIHATEPLRRGFAGFSRVR